MMTESQILKLRPKFEFGHMTMIDWYQITKGANCYSIRNGLWHADGETKSPYYFTTFSSGKNAKKECLQKFTEWWNSFKH
jgi:hypothetical protein